MPTPAPVRRRARPVNADGPVRRSWPAWTRAILPVVLAGAVSAGCGAKAKALNDPVSPALAVPAPPPRVQTAVEDVPLASSPLLADGPIADIAPATIKSAPPRQTASRGSEARPQPSPAGAPPAAAQEPVAQLRMVPASEQAAEIKAIDGYLTSALGNLDKVRTKLETLSQGNREQYDLARQFVESAVKAKAELRLSYARSQAEKAATIARDLASR